ncbi:hypothetical protein DFH09DRAFT_1361825 [Mycena vulgaris]|nr:hypothetical protein DFH09DRAFT_1361825 [Mycena vulgaris]
MENTVTKSMHQLQNLQLASTMRGDGSEESMGPVCTYDGACGEGRDPEVLVALALVCVLVLVPVIHALFPRSSSRTPPYDTALFLYTRPTACTPRPSALRSRVSLLTVPSPTLPLFPLPCHSSSLSLVPFARLRYLSSPSLALPPSMTLSPPLLPPSHPLPPLSRATLASPSPLRLIFPRAASPLPPSSPYLQLLLLCRLCAISSPRHPILSPRVRVPPPRIHTLSIPAPCLSSFFPHSVLPLLPPLPPSPFPLPALPSALPSASSPSSPPHLRPHPHPPLSISSVYPRRC